MSLSVNFLQRSPGGGKFLLVGNDKLVHLLVQPLRNGAGGGNGGSACFGGSCRGGRALSDQMAINVGHRHDMIGSAGDEGLFRHTDIFQGYIPLCRAEPRGGDPEDFHSGDPQQDIFGGGDDRIVGGDDEEIRTWTFRDDAVQVIQDIIGALLADIGLQPYSHQVIDGFRTGHLAAVRVGNEPDGWVTGGGDGRVERFLSDDEVWFG